MAGNKFRIILVLLIVLGAAAIAAAVFLNGLHSAYAMIIGVSALAMTGVAFVLLGIIKILRRPSIDDSAQETDDQEQLGEIDKIVSDRGLPSSEASFGLVGAGDLLGGVNGVGEFYNHLTGELDYVKDPGGVYGDPILGDDPSDDD